MRGQNAFVFNLNMIIHIFQHLSNAFSPGPAGRRGRGAFFSRFWTPAAGGCAPFCRRTRAGIWCFFPKTAGGRAAKRCIRPNFGIEPPGSLVPPAAGPPCRQGSPEEPLRATAGKVRRSAKNSSQGRSFPFLSTLPARGATYFLPRCFLCTIISIHAPRKGSDSARSPACQSHHYFYPHSPQRGATRQPRGRLLDGPISIHTPRKGNDDKIQQTSKMDFAQKSQIKT